MIEALVLAPPGEARAAAVRLAEEASAAREAAADADDPAVAASA